MGIELARALIAVRADASRVQGDINAARPGVESAVKGIVQSIGGIRSALLGLAGVGAAIGAVFKAGQFEQTNIAFETMIGNVEETKKTLADLTEFAAKTPFEMPEILQAARGLIQFGERGEDLMKTLNMLGNAASGTSTSFGMVALIFNQIRGVGKLLTQDFRQLSTRGILSLQDIAKYYKTTTEGVQKLLSTGKITFKDVQGIFEGMSKEGGRFNNLMERQSQSLLGLWSTYKDALGITARQIGEVLLPAAKSFVRVLISGTEGIRNFVTENTGLTTALIYAAGAWLGVKVAILAVNAAMKSYLILKGLVTAAEIVAAPKGVSVAGGGAAGSAVAGAGGAVIVRSTQTLIGRLAGVVASHPVGAAAVAVASLIAAGVKHYTNKVMRAAAANEVETRKPLSTFSEYRQAGKGYFAQFEQGAAVSKEDQAAWDQHQAERQAAVEAFTTSLEKQDEVYNKLRFDTEEEYQAWKAHNTAGVDPADIKRFRERAQAIKEMTGNRSAAEQIKSMREQADLLGRGLSDAQKQLIKLSKTPGVTQQQIADMKSLQATMEWGSGFDRMKESLAALNEEIYAMANGLSDAQVEARKLFGAKPGETQQQSSQRRQLTAEWTQRRQQRDAMLEQRKSLEGLKDAAKSLKDSLKSPYQSFKEELFQLRDMFGHGLINEAQLKQGIELARKKALGTAGPASMSGQIGLAEYGRRIQDELLKSQNDTGLKQLEQARIQNTKLDDIVKAIKADKVAGVFK
jgi:tape measure domain-containing protein